MNSNSTISSRTPEGLPNRCDVCGLEVYLEPSQPAGDAPCPHCGTLLWWFQERLPDLPVGADDTAWLDARLSELVEGDSLAVIELVMEFEDVFKVPIPDSDYERLKTVRDVIRYIARHRQPPSTGV